MSTAHHMNILPLNNLALSSNRLATPIYFALIPKISCTTFVQEFRLTGLEFPANQPEPTRLHHRPKNILQTRR